MILTGSKVRRNNPGNLAKTNEVNELPAFM